MKKIVLREKLIPYSTQPGVCFPYPCTSELLQFFPCYLVITDLEEKQLILHFSFPSIALKIHTFYSLFDERFDVQLQFKEGIFHYQLFKTNEKWFLEVKRCTLSVQMYEALDERVKKHLQKGDILSFSFGPSRQETIKRKEVLLLGCHKKSQVEKIFYRQNFLEILPHLFLLGQMRPKVRVKTYLGPFSFFKDVHTLAKEKKHHALLLPLKELFRSFFSPGFIPHLTDVHHLGQSRICSQLKDQERFEILRRFYEIIRIFFFERKQNELFFFSHLPSELHSGKGIEFEEKDFRFSFEWSKKMLKKMEFVFSNPASYTFHFPKEIKSFRLQIENKSSVLKNGQLIKVEANKTYFMDRFQK